jgi:hypothetical protein
MGLLQNIMVLNAEPVDYTGKSSEYYPSCLNWQMNKYVSMAGWDKKSGVPEGYAPPYCFQLALKDGGMSSYNQIIGSGIVLSGALTKGQNFPTSTITGSGTISSGALSMLVQLIATLTGNGEITKDSTTLEAILNMAASISGSGTITTSPLNVIAWCVASVLGQGNLTATMKGWADMSANITSAGDVVTAQSCAAAVWNALAAAYDTSGTMGEQLNNVGAGANPWTSPIEGSYTAEDIMKILLSVMAGKTTIVKGSGTTATVKFRDVNDTKDRVVATMDGSQRTSVTLNDN